MMNSKKTYSSVGKNEIAGPDGLKILNYIKAEITDHTKTWTNREHAPIMHLDLTSRSHISINNGKA